MPHFIVIGNPIAHSKSPIIHHYFGDITGINVVYHRQLCPIDADGLSTSFATVVSAFFAGGGVGANVTLPFKETAHALCAQNGALSQDAAAARAVNTLAHKNGKLFGDNTDGKGLMRAICQILAQHNLGNLHNKTVLLLGAGGAARGALLPLLKAGARVAIFNRTQARALDLLADLLPFLASNDGVNSSDNRQQLPDQNANTPLRTIMPANFLPHYDLIINATSAAANGIAMDYAALLGDTTAALAYDMMYGKPSAFLHHFAQRGTLTADGTGMLINQAAYSFALWHNLPPDQLFAKLDYGKLARLLA